MSLDRDLQDAAVGSAASFRAMLVAFFDLAALLKHLRVLLKVSVANFNFCASVERGLNVSGVVKMTRFEVGRDLTGFARWEEAVAEDLVVGLAEPLPSRRTVELELDTGSVGSSKPSRARSSFSGAIDGRPNAAYIWSKIGDNIFSASSAICRIGRNGCFAGTRSSGER